VWLHIITISFSRGLVEENLKKLNYYHLKSILASDKKTFAIRNPSPSFQIITERKTPYIEPSFEKVIYEMERPTVILVSAVGATGKSALAGVLSYDTGLPVLDLSKHKPVGDNTLTGLLTTAYDVKDIGGVLGGLSDGSYGIIIDGIDEGRSKTNEKAFEAFLDDIVNLSKSSPNTTFVMLGRTQILDECWSYFTDKGLDTGLITISPFTIESAKKYIDEFTKGTSSAFAQQYEAVRDYIIEKLGAAFLANPNERSADFLSFIGYPPVLDAIVTLLAQENNYHKLMEELKVADGGNLEVSLLFRIAVYILEREREQKALPNIVEPILKDVPANIRDAALPQVFSREEQSLRLIAYCLGELVTLSTIPEPKLNERYEAQLASWLPEHPFLSGREFRNAVFEAVALATLITSRDPLSEQLASRYAKSHKHSYHLVYMISAITSDNYIAVTHLNTLLTAAMEFRSVHSSVELRVEGEEDYVKGQPDNEAGRVSIEIEILIGEDDEASKKFSFETAVTGDSRISLGPRLASAFVTVPCAVELASPEDIELIAPVEVSAPVIDIKARSLVVRPTAGQKGEEQSVVLSAARIESHVDIIYTNGASLDLSVDEIGNLSYPAFQYAQKRSNLPSDELLLQKYMRLKRIMLEFRSHSRRSLGKYKDRIEHERVAGNEMGRKLLQRLLADKVLSIDGIFYRVDPDALNKQLGTTWQDLRRGQTSEELLDYLRSIR